MIVATAGHVDHGKTRLVEALTGIDTDTLAEEKRRGLTIDIGFAYLPVEGFPSIGFIDVPGHERFIKNALCGLAASGFVLLVVAADDGPMLQTIEHLSIIDLLDIENGAIVVSKIDLVTASQIEKVKTLINGLIKNTRLKSWPTYLVSSLNHQGIDQLRDKLVQQASSIKTDFLVQTNFRMAIDRTFEKKGIGLIVTGTIFSGTVKTDDAVIIAGSPKQLRVRGLHVQNSEADYGQQTQRCAINLAGTALRKDQIRRGDWLTSPQVASPVDRFDGEIRVLEFNPKSLKHWTPVHLHLAASQTTARVAVLEAGSIKAGKTGLVQIVCDHPVGAVFGDQFIIRDQSARYTLGGGRVIDIFPPKRGRARPERIDFLRQANQTDVQAGLEGLLSLCNRGVDLTQFSSNRNLSQPVVDDSADMVVLNLGNRRIGFSQDIAQAQDDKILQALDIRGLSESQLLNESGLKLPPNIFKTFLNRLLKSSIIKKDSGGYALTTHQVEVSDEEKAFCKEIRQLLTEAGIRALSTIEIKGNIDISTKQLNIFLSKAVCEGSIVKLSADLILLPACLTELHNLINQLVPDHQTFTVAEFRDTSGIGRNRCIEILECFDAKGITQRINQGRRLQPMAENALAKLLK